MIFRKHKISNLKIKIWNAIHELQEKAPGQSPEVVAQIEYLYNVFNVLTVRDTKIEYDGKPVVKLYKLSYKLVDFILENYKKDKHFKCLHVVVNWLTTYLWSQAYLGRGRVDEAIVDGVADMFDELQDKLDGCLNNIVLFEKVNDDVQAAIKRADSNELLSLKGRYDNFNRLIKGYQYDINAKEEAFLAHFQVGALNADRVKANFDYTDEVNEATKREFEKIEEAAQIHYQFVRTAVDQMIIDSQVQSVNDGTDEKVQNIEKANDEKRNIKERVKELLEAEHVDIVAIYANLRLAIDTYLKYEKGIDLNLSEGGFLNKDTGIMCEYEKKYKSKKVFIELFGETNGLYVDEIWSTSSDLLHGGTQHLTLDLDPEAIRSLKSKAEGYASFLDDIMDINNIHYFEGTKLLYQRRKQFLRDYKERWNLQNYSVGRNKTLQDYEKYLRAKGVEDDFFFNKPKDKAPAQEAAPVEEAPKEPQPEAKPEGE